MPIFTVILSHSPGCVCVSRLLNHSSNGGHVDSLHIVNSTAANMGMQMALYVLISFPLDKNLEEGSLSHVLGPFVIVRKFPHCYSH